MAGKIDQSLLDFAIAHGRSRLTPAECRVIPLVAEGLQSRAIAQRMGIKCNTVYTYLESIYSKLGVKRRAELARMYWNNEIIELSEFRLLIPALEKAIEEVTGGRKAV